MEQIGKVKRRPTGEEIEAVIKAPLSKNTKESVHSLLVTGLVELCKVKPVGVDAVDWLGDWLLDNNPNKPAILETYDVAEPEE